MKDVRFPKVLVFVNALVPLTLLLWDVYRKQVGANPLEFVTRTTGMLTLVFLTVTIAVTPVRTSEPRITVVCPTATPATSVIASSAPGDNTPTMIARPRRILRKYRRHDQNK